MAEKVNVPSTPRVELGFKDFRSDHMDHTFYFLCRLNLT